MMFKVSKERKSPSSFAVCLLSVPEFPAQNEHIWDVVRTPLQAVIGAVYDNEGWSFTNLSKEEKISIGDQLNDNNAGEDEWWWCEQFENK